MSNVPLGVNSKSLGVHQFWELGSRLAGIGQGGDVP